MPNTGTATLGGGHDNRAGQGNVLRQAQLCVAGAGRHIDNQAIELAPQNVTQQLLDRRHHHRPAPDHRLFFIDKEADGHGLDAISDERPDGAALGLRLSFEA
jgi:hypothetical protein